MRINLPTCERDRAFQFLSFFPTRSTIKFEGFFTRSANRNREVFFHHINTTNSPKKNSLFLTNSTAESDFRLAKIYLLTKGSRIFENHVFHRIDFRVVSPIEGDTIIDKEEMWTGEDTRETLASWRILAPQLAWEEPKKPLHRKRNGKRTSPCLSRFPVKMERVWSGGNASVDELDKVEGEAKTRALG